MMWLMKDDWSQLFLNMWNDYSAHKEAMDKFMAESIARFCSECIVVIDKSLKFGILQLNCSHPLSMMSCLEDRVVFILVFVFLSDNHRTTFPPSPSPPSPIAVSN